MILSWQQIPSPIISELMCHGFDGVVLDTEHACFNLETLFSCIQVVKLAKKRAFVRLTEISKTMIRNCLDSDVDGIIFSTVETEKQCKKILEYCYYHPKGKRGLGLTRQNFWGEKKLINSSPIIIPQIETKAAVDNLSKITKHDFDFYLIGPYDLSLSLGVPAKFENSLFLNYINKVKKAVPDSKMAIHIPNNVDEQIEKYANYGLKCLGMDTVSIIESNKRSLKNVKF
tara:strand:- start:350 stop:1036 length:687 start_codon:yes stop_codon:yes gene_type:complete